MDRATEAQRRIPPEARGVPWLTWWMSAKSHQAVSKKEVEQWLIQKSVADAAAKTRLRL